MSSMHQRADGDPASRNHANDPVLHVIDFEDVALSPTGVQMVELGAQAVLRKYMPEADLDNLTRAKAFEMFINQVYWEENTGGLIMCTELGEANLCLPIPPSHWSIKPSNGFVH